MANRLDGYMSEIAYPAHFESRTAPAWIAGAMALAGLRPPSLRRFRLLDLGCGDGIGLAASAAAHPEAAFEGIDGAEAHVARGLAFPGRPKNLTLRAATFEAATGGAADCDFVTAQGVLAWVSPAARAALFDLAAARLAPGGVFAVGYNAMPGWAGRMALRRALVAFAAGAEGGPVERFDAALAAVEALGGTALGSVPTGLVEWLRKLRGEAPEAYFPHEWLSEGWAPLWSVEAMAMAAARGLRYAGQAGFDRIRPDLTLRRAQREALARVPEAERDGMVDLFRDASFRVDLYVRDAAADPEARDALWLAAAAGPEAPLEHAGPAGRLRFDNEAARRLMAALSEGPRAFAEIAAEAPLGLADLRNALDCLLIAGLVRPAAPRAADGAPAERFNRAARETGVVTALAGAFGPVSATAAEMAAAAPSARLLRLGVERF